MRPQQRGRDRPAQAAESKDRERRAYAKYQSQLKPPRKREPWQSAIKAGGGTETQVNQNPTVSGDR